VNVWRCKRHIPLPRILAGACFAIPSEGYSVRPVNETGVEFCLVAGRLTIPNAPWRTPFRDRRSSSLAHDHAAYAFRQFLGAHKNLLFIAMPPRGGAIYRRRNYYALALGTGSRCIAKISRGKDRQSVLREFTRACDQCIAEGSGSIGGFVLQFCHHVSDRSLFRPPDFNPQFCACLRTRLHADAVAAFVSTAEPRRRRSERIYNDCSCCFYRVRHQHRNGHRSTPPGTRRDSRLSWNFANATSPTRR